MMKKKKKKKKHSFESEKQTLMFTMKIIKIMIKKLIKMIRIKLIKEKIKNK